MRDFLKIQRCLIAIILFSVILRTNAYSYKDAKTWGQKYKQCKGKNQSPITLNEDEMGFQAFNGTMKLTDFNKSPTKVTIKNTGHTVEVRAKWSGTPPSVSGGPLHGNYVFEKITFHWDQKERTIGSVENTMFENGSLPYTLDMEMHMFFYKKDLKSFEKAETQKGGLAVFNVGLKTNAEPKKYFEILEKNVHKVKSQNSAATIPSFRLTGILDVPHQEPYFAFHEGSLDYPPCSESVAWFITGYNSEYCITDKLLKEFRKINLSDGDKSNLRPFQEKGNREIIMVYTYYGKQG